MAAQQIALLGLLSQSLLFWMEQWQDSMHTRVYSDILDFQETLSRSADFDTMARFVAHKSVVRSSPSSRMLE